MKLVPYVGVVLFFLICIAITDAKPKQQFDIIPKDIIICPWHYEQRESYLSIPMLLEKGFRVLPAGWKDVDATRALIQFNRAHANPKLLDHMFTTWGVKKEELLQFPPLVEGLPLIQAAQ